MSEAYESNYHIAQGENVQGPYTFTKMLQLIADGRARPEMLFSRDGADWVEGFDCPELFGEPEPSAATHDQVPPPPTRGTGDNPGLHRRGSRGGGGRAAGGRGRGRSESHRGGVILALGILGLMLSCGLFGIFAWVMANTDLAKMRAGRMDPSGEGLTTAGKILGIISVAMMALVFVWFMFLGGLAAVSSTHGTP